MIDPDREETRGDDQGIDCKFTVKPDPVFQWGKDECQLERPGHEIEIRNLSIGFGD